jgi:hypothetical protein
MARIRGKGEFMAWTLDIHVIDVGAGDSSLIIANDPVGGNSTSMLIDGGLTSSARTVHNKVVASLPGPALNTILVSHYDVDHSIGIAGLLLSDNLLALCGIIAQKTVQALPGPGYVREDEVARMAARAAAAGRVPRSSRPTSTERRPRSPSPRAPPTSRPRRRASGSSATRNRATSPG